LNLTIDHRFADTFPATQISLQVTPTAESELSRRTTQESRRERRERPTRTPIFSKAIQQGICSKDCGGVSESLSRSRPQWFALGAGSLVATVALGFQRCVGLSDHLEGREFGADACRTQERGTFVAPGLLRRPGLSRANAHSTRGLTRRLVQSLPNPFYIFPRSFAYARPGYSYHALCVPRSSSASGKRSRGLVGLLELVRKSIGSAIG